MKYCTSCERDLPDSEFTPRTAAHDGLQAFCKRCMRGAKALSREKRLPYYQERERQTMRRYYQRHRERILLKRKEAAA